MNNNYTSHTWEKLIDDRSRPIYNKSHEYSYRAQFEDPYMNRYTSSDHVTRGIWKRTLLSDVFFSKENINNVDAMLRYAVYKLSKGEYVLGKQNLFTLKIIMRGIFFQYALNLGNKFVKFEIERLNKIVIKRIAPDLLTRCTGYLNYLKEANEGHKSIISRPVNVSSAGIKSLQIGDAIGFQSGNDITRYGPDGPLSVEWNRNLHYY